MNFQDYEVARPGLPPLDLQTLRPTHDPEQIYGETTREKSFMFNKNTKADARTDNPNRLRLKQTKEPQTSFQICTGITGQPRDEWEVIDTFTDLEVAKHNLALLKETAINPVVLRKLVAMEANHDPAVWATDRSQTGEWIFPDWVEQPWFTADPEHFVHLSVGLPTNVAYWPTRRDAQNDKVVVIPAGHYLKKFFGEVLAPEEIVRLVYAADPPGDLEFSGSDGEAIAKVYINSEIYSCMKKSNISPKNHPTTIYGAGDLEMVSLLRNGTTIARALCWPERKFAGCIYGDTVRMKIALDCAGFTRDYAGNSSSTTEGGGGFEGARLLKVRSGGSWLMPWIDLGYRVWDDGEFFRLSLNKGAYVNNTGNTYSGGIPS